MRALGLGLLLFLVAGCGRSALFPGSFASPSHSPTPSGTQPPQLTDWSARRRIDIERGWLTSTLTDFPVLVTLDDATFDFSALQDDGADLRFTDSLGTLLSYEIDEWDPAGQALIWVRIPLIEEGVGPVSFWMYYGQPQAPAGQDAAATWTKDYVGVWHLRGDDSDSSGSGNDLTQNTTTRADGALGDGREFAGNNSTYIVVSDAASLNPPTQISVSAWLNSDSWNNGNRRILQKGNADDEFRLTDENNQLLWQVAGVAAQTSNLPSTGEWHHVAGTYDGTRIRTWIDGSIQAEGPANGAMPVTGDPLHIGTKHFDADDGDHFNGVLDEVRVASRARSADWIQGQWLSMTGALLTVGPEQTVPP